MKKLNKTWWAYFAGLLDGEGCIGVYKRKPRPGHPYEYACRISISNNHKGVIRMIQKALGGCINPHASGHGGLCQTWTLSGVNSEIALKNALPFMLVKKTQALVYLKLRTRIQQDNKAVTYKEGVARDKLCKRLKALKRAY